MRKNKKRFKSNIKNSIDEVLQLQKDEVNMLRDRMTFVGVLGIAILVFDLLSYAVIFENNFADYDFMGSIIGALVSAVFIFTVRKFSNAVTLKISAFTYICVWLFLLTWGEIHDMTPYPDFVVGYVMILLTSSLIIPWFPYEVIPIFFAATTVYTFHFFYWNDYILDKTVDPVSNTDYFSGLSLLLMSFMICIIARRYEMHEALKKFRLRKELSEKNNQMSKELELATRVHSRIIPHSENTKLADIEVTYVPMYYMSGDYAKFYVLGDNKLIFIICDVTGHGVSAALLVNALNAEFERIAKEGKSPGALMKELDSFIKEDFGEVNMYLTAFCGLLDNSRFSRKLVYSNYGHPPQYLYRNKTGAIEKLPPQTSFVGLPGNDDNIYESELLFDTKDSVVLFTDGVTEAKNSEGKEFGSEGVESFIRANIRSDIKVFNKDLLEEINLFTGKDLKDDVFILNIKTK